MTPTKRSPMPGEDGEGEPTLVIMTCAACHDMATKIGDADLPAPQFCPFCGTRILAFGTDSGPGAG